MLFAKVHGQLENEIMQLIREDNTIFLDTSILNRSDTNRKDGFWKHGVWRFRNNKAELTSVRTFYSDRPHGQTINFWENKITNSIYYYDGVQYGPFITFGKNGKPQSYLHYKGGIIDGIAKDFDTSGQIVKIVRYIDNQKEGLEVSLYSSGNIKYLKNYIKGKENGVRKVYRDTAVLDLIAEYEVENGEIIREKIYDKEALPIDIPMRIDGIPPVWSSEQPKRRYFWKGAE